MYEATHFESPNTLASPRLKTFSIFVLFELYKRCWPAYNVEIFMAKGHTRYFGPNGGPHVEN